MFGRCFDRTLTSAVLVTLTAAESGAVIDTVTWITCEPNPVNTWVPMTVKVPSLPLIVPALYRPLPQLMVATKRPAVVAAFASSNVATGPTYETPLVMFMFTDWPVSTSGCAPVAAPTATLAAEMPALDTARVRK